MSPIITTTSMILFENYDPDGEHPYNGLINEELRNF